MARLGLTISASIALSLSVFYFGECQHVLAQGFFLGENLEEPAAPAPTPPSTPAPPSNARAEEAIAFLTDRMPCARDNYSDRNALWAEANHIGVSFENGTMTVREETRSMRKKDFYRQHSFYYSTVKLSELSPMVGLEKEKVVVVECTKGKCFSTEEGGYIDGEKLVTDTAAERKQFYRLCDSSTAERVRRAFSTLIEASGGKAPAF